MQSVVDRAKRLGFTQPHIVDLDQFPLNAGERLRDFVAQRHHGTMSWMEETLERRVHPRAFSNKSLRSTHGYLGSCSSAGGHSSFG